MDLHDFLTLIDDNSLQGMIIGISTLVFWIFDSIFGVPKIMMKMFYNFVEVVLKKKIKHKWIDAESRHLSESDIKKHDIFNYLNFWIYSKVPTLVFSSDYRTSVFRNYLTIYLKTHKTHFKQFLDDDNYKKMSDTELWSGLLGLINEIIYQYESEMKINNIPIIVIEKMKIINNDKISLTINLMESVCNNTFYNSENNYLKIYSILNIYLAILENTINMSVNVCDSINGQLH